MLKGGLAFIMLPAFLVFIDMAGHQQFYISFSRFLFMFVKQKLEDPMSVPEILGPEQRTEAHHWA